MTHKESAASAVKTFLDVFGGTDGGVDFVKVKSKLEALGNLADSGDKSAIQIIERVAAIERLMKFIIKD